MQSPADLGHAVTADRILLVDPEHTVLVGIERHWLAVTFQIGAGRRKIVEGALALDKLQMDQPAGGIVNINETGAPRPTTLEPPMIRPVNLDQFAQTIAPGPRLMNCLQPGAPILPYPSGG